MTTRWTRLDSPVGELLLTADETGALTSLSVPGQKNGRTVQEGWRHDPGPFRAAREQLASAASETGGDSPRLQAAVAAATLTAAAQCPAAAASAQPAAAEAAKEQKPAPEVTAEVRAAQVDSVFAQQRLDPSWARDAERSIGDALREHVGTSTLEQLECKATLCKARLRHSDPEKFSAFLDRVVGSSAAIWKGEIYSYREPPGADGVVHNAMYFSKEGSESAL